MVAKNQDYFKTFCKISKAFGTTQQLQELLDLIVESAIETMQGKAACLFLADRKHDVFVKKAQKGLSKNYLHANPVKAKKTEGKLVEKGFYFIYDATRDKQAENKELKKKEGIASVLVVPVMVNGEIIGVLSLYTAKKRKFSSDEINFLAALAEQGGMAIEKSRLIEQVRTNTRLFHEMSANINSSLDIKEVLHNLTEHLCESLSMKGVSIRLLNQETGDLPIVASYGLSDEFLYKDKGSVQKNLQKTLNGKPLVIENMQTDGRVRYKADLRKEGIGSALIVPIKVKSEVVGIMRLFSEEEQEFSEDTVNLVSALAEQGGLAIQNASLILMLQEDKKNLEQDMWINRSFF